MFLNFSSAAVMMIVVLFEVLFLNLVASGDAFSMTFAPRTLVISKMSLFNTEDPIECYLILEEDEEEHGFPREKVPKGEKDLVVCTSSPEEYAWFNGIEEKNMIPIENEDSMALECVEGASPRGIPEWECK